MRYLIGDFSDRRSFTGEYANIAFKHSIGKEDLLTAKTDSYWQIIDLHNRTFFDPDKNAWVDIKSE